MELNREQLSLLISFFIMMLVVLILFNVHLAEQAEKEILYELHFEEPQEENEEKATSKESELQTHMAYNEAVTSKFDKEIREFKTLEEIKEGKTSEENSDEDVDDETSSDTEAKNDYLRSTSGAGSLPSQGTKKQRSQQSSGDNSSNAIAKNNTINTNSSISYSLIGRVHKKLPNPVYTCTSRGKIVINIKVDALGNVVEATFNRKSSTSSNGCLIDHAIAYALRSTFSRDENKKDQMGTITYLFQAE